MYLKQWLLPRCVSLNHLQELLYLGWGCGILDTGIFLIPHAQHSRHSISQEFWAWGIRNTLVHCTKHTFTHSYTPRGNLSSPVHLKVCFKEVGGNRSTQRIPREHTKFHTDSNLSAESGIHCTTMPLHLQFSSINSPVVNNLVIHWTCTWKIELMQSATVDRRLVPIIFPALGLKDVKTVNDLKLSLNCF